MNILIILDKKSPEEEYVFRYIFDILGIFAHLNFSYNLPKNTNKFDIILKYSLHKNKITHNSVIDIFKSENKIRDPSFVRLKKRQGSFHSNQDIIILKTELREAGKNPIFDLANAEEISAVSYEKNNKACCIYINFDMIKSLIYFMSLEHEKSLEEKGKTINSFFRNIPYNKLYVQQPIINQAIFLIRNLIHFLINSTRNPIIEKSLYPDYAPCMLCLTHDVDGIRKDIVDRLKHLGHSAVRITSQLMNGRIVQAVGELKLLFIKLFSNADYNQFKAIIKIEKQFYANSSFNFFVKTNANQRTLKERLLNPRYDIKKNPIQEILRLLSSEGKEIALHGSYNSFNNENIWNIEKKLLEKTIKQDVLGGRQHFLGFSTTTNFNIYKKNKIAYDTTYGFRDINGFRASICLPFKPFNKTLDKPYPTLEIPLIIMDGVFFDRDVKSKDTIWYETLRILKEIKANYGCGSIVWHNRVFNKTDYPSWSELYIQALKWAGSEKAALCSPKEILQWFNNRNSLILKKHKRNKDRNEYTLNSASKIKSMPLNIYTGNQAGITHNITCNHRTKIQYENPYIKLIIYGIEPNKDIRITIK